MEAVEWGVQQKEVCSGKAKCVQGSSQGMSGQLVTKVAVVESGQVGMGPIIKDE